MNVNTCTWTSKNSSAVFNSVSR